MHFNFIIGIDMSKEWFHFCLKNHQNTILWEGEIDNNPEAIFSFLSKLAKQQDITQSKTPLSKVVMIMEHTGVYVNHLVNAYLSKGGSLSLVHANKVSNLLGGTQKFDEKTDQIDARRLAEYGIRYSDKIQLWTPKEHTLTKLQALERQRSRTQDAINKLEVPLNESKRFDSADVSEMLAENQKVATDALKELLKNIERQILDLIKSEPHLKQLFKLITSVPGVGPVIATEMIIATSAFEDFKPDQAKQFARYAGVTPKSFRSGKMKRKDRTTKRGNKKIKSLLTLGAMALINSNKTELGFYYRTKINQGKKHLSVINAMRNKIILRIFAVVRNQVMYEKNMHISLT